MIPLPYMDPCVLTISTPHQWLFAVSEGNKYWVSVLVRSPESLKWLSSDVAVGALVYFSTWCIRVRIMRSPRTSDQNLATQESEWVRILSFSQYQHISNTSHNVSIWLQGVCLIHILCGVPCCMSDHFVRITLKTFPEFAKFSVRRIRTSIPDLSLDIPSKRSGYCMSV